MAMNEERINGVCMIMFKDQWATMPKMQQFMVKEQVMKILACNDEYNKQNNIVETKMDDTMFDFLKEGDG